MKSFENVRFEEQMLTVKDSLNELREMLEKTHKLELEYLKLKAENRKERAARGLPW